MANRLVSLISMLAMVTLAAIPATAASRTETKFVPQDYIVGAWWLYKSLFIEGGRVVDRSNGNVSHSEGQGYGMFLAVAANDREAFDALWTWTQRNLYTRGDELAAWKWDPGSTPHVADTNNASDGDLLIAWALARAGRAWSEPGLTDKARAIVETLTEKAIITTADHGTVLLPAASGFSADDQPDGPVVNLSYWVFPAIAELGSLSAAFPARQLTESGSRLLEQSRFGTSQLPSDWIALKDRLPMPADNFAPNFGYEAVRIPLYAAWAGTEQAGRLRPIQKRWNEAGPNTVQVVEIATSASLVAMPDPGYQAVSELLSCSLGDAKGHVITSFEPTEYYPSTLHLMSIVAISERYPQCLASLN